MSFQLIVSNSLKSLADSLSQKIQIETSVFQPIYVVTQTEGMNAWLRLQIAEKLGIAANIQFLKPNDIINLIYKNLGGNYIQSISTHDMNWLLYKLLGEKEFIEKYPNISSYYEFAGNFSMNSFSPKSLYNNQFISNSLKNIQTFHLIMNLLESTKTSNEWLWPKKSQTFLINTKCIELK